MPPARANRIRGSSTGAHSFNVIRIHVLDRIVSGDLKAGCCLLSPLQQMSILHSFTWFLYSSILLDIQSIDRMDL